METYSKDDINITLNTALADAYVDELRKMQARYALPTGPDLAVLARLPDLMSVERAIDEDKAAADIWEGLEEAASQALQRFIEMRAREGRAMCQDMAEHLKIIAQGVGLVAERAPLVAAEYAERLRLRLTEYLADAAPDEARLLTEVAIFADRCCIDEELARMESHIAQFSAMLSAKQTGPVGRKLDFLMQELNREVNTIGSKSNDLQITKTVVDLKSRMEKIREQVQNVE
jgi:uncharacterized protein (TIGR00255 family)